MNWPNVKYLDATPLLSRSSGGSLELRKTACPTPCPGRVSRPRGIGCRAWPWTRPPRGFLPVRGHRCGAPKDGSPRRQPWDPGSKGSPAPAGRQKKHLPMKEGRHATTRQRGRSDRGGDARKMPGLRSIRWARRKNVWRPGSWGFCRPCRGWLCMGRRNPALTRWAIICRPSGPGATALEGVDRAESRWPDLDQFTLESAFGATDFADSTDKQGLGFALPHTCEVRAQPCWKHPFQPRPSVESAVKTTAVFRFNTTR